MKTCPVCSVTYASDIAFCPKDGSALRSSTGLEPGSVIRKKYQIVSEIGRGGMGVVYRAKHLVWGEERALKVLSGGAGSGQDLDQSVKALLGEAQVLRQFHHPHIVRVEDIDFTEDNQPFVVMELVEGQSLSDRIKKTGPLDPEHALHIAIEACSALAAAHQKGIVHRDIKPQNILLAKQAGDKESVKLIDFGIAKVREETGLGFTGILTGTTGFTVCTPAYASPEQAQGMSGSKLDGRSDIYSLALVLYEMLTGRLPFEADNGQGLLLQRLLRDPLPIVLKPPHTFSMSLSVFMAKALERDREKRFQSAEEMQREIVEILSSGRKVLASIDPELTRRTVVCPTGNLRKTAIQSKAVVALGGVVLLAVGFWLWKERELQNPAVVALNVAKNGVRVNPVDGLYYVYIPPGRFVMGCSPGDNRCHENEKPPHPEEISIGFWMGQTEVTQAAWMRVNGGRNPSRNKGDQLPVETVTWGQAQKYCKDVGGRLPTEGEWEYAARGNTTTPIYGPLEAVAWYCYTGRNTHPVGLKQPNIYGLYDMIGNVWEWTEGVSEAEKYVTRGGSWGCNGLWDLRASAREPSADDTGGNGAIGFRCVGQFR